MFSTRRARWLEAALAIAITMYALPAAADGSPKVRLAPSPAGPTSALLDRGLPASTEFTIEMRLGDFHIPAGVAVRGKIDIWPEAEQQCSTVPPVAGTLKQHHTLGLSVSGSDPDRVLSATVPPLQVGQTFCFAVDVHPTLSDAQLEQAAIAAAKGIAPKLAAAANCGIAATPNLFGAELANALAPIIGKIPDTTTAAPLAASAFSSTGMNACLAAQRAQVVLETTRGNIETLQGGLNAARAALQALPPPAGLTEPFVLTGGGVVLGSQMLAEEGNYAPPVLRQAEAQLDVRSTGAANAAFYQQWARLLGKLAKDLDEAAKLTENVAADKKAEAEKKAAVARKKAFADANAAAVKLRASTTFPLEIAKGTAFVPFDAYKTSPETPAPAKVLAQLSLLDRPGVVPPAERAKLRNVVKAIEDFQQQSDNLSGVQSSEADMIAKRNVALHALEDEVVNAFKKSLVRNEIEGAVQNVQLSGVAGQGETPNHANYISADLGVVLGFPTGGPNAQAWLMPYGGLTFYTTAVDRKVPLDQLTGRNGQAFRQRVSLTLGMTLTDPSLPGRTITKPLGFGNYPLLALGVRLTHFVRITGGTVFYRIADPNPASADSTLHVAPFVGASLDADVVHLLTQNLK